MNYIFDDFDSWYNIKDSDISNNIDSTLNIDLLRKMKNNDLLVFLKKKGILSKDENIHDAMRWLSIETAIKKKNNVAFNYYDYDYDYNKKNN